MDNTKLAIKVSAVSIGVNALLSFMKFIAGFIGHSSAMISDAVHSLSDVLSTFVVIAGVKIADKESDAHHPYGHERLECVAAIILSALLFLVGLGIGMAGIRKIIYMDSTAIEIPGITALSAALLSLGVKEAMYWYTRSAAKKINSGALMADAWHHRSDALSSVGSFIGIMGARMGFPVLDPIASIIICAFILKVSFDIFKDSMNKMVDRACDEKTTQEMKNVICSVEGVESLDLIQTRLFGSKIYVDIEISADGNLPLYKAHGIAQEVHDKMEKSFPLVKHCMVHVNPK